MKVISTIYQGRARLVLWSALIGSVAIAAAPIGSDNPKTKKPAQVKSTRRTTDPPVASRGKLGQDLFLAIDHRDTATVQSLIKQGADPNARNGLEFAPLYIAAASHQPEVVKILLDAGAEFDAESSYGTPLMFAVATANAQDARVLLDRGANVNASRVDGISVLMMASNAGSPEVTGELLKRKADVDATDNSGLSALAYAARGGHKEIVGQLIAAGAKVDTVDDEGQTPLMLAAATGRTEVVKMLLAAGAKPNRVDKQGRTALFLASSTGDHTEVVRALIGAGAKPGVADSKGRTAAAMASARGYAGASKILGAPTKASLAAVGHPRAAKDAVKTSLRALQSSMWQFNRSASCLSCHQEGLGRIATGVAREHGFVLDEGLQKAQTGRIRGALSAMLPLHAQALKNDEAMKQVPLIEINEVTPADTWLLAGMASQGDAPNEATAAMAAVLARQQQADGHWNFSVPRIPMQSSFFTFTALAVRSLNAYAPKSVAKETAERVGRAKAWLAQTPARTSEDRASRVMGLKWAGASRDELRMAMAEVVSDQRADGGWSQMPDLQSDAYATGQALYALSLAGMPTTDPVYQRGVKYLLRTQEADGSWFVSKRAIPLNNYFDAGFPHGASQYASFNGTCWATMALLQTIPAKRR